MNRVQTMKFTEEKLEKAYTMVNGQLLMVNGSSICQVFCSINLTTSKCPVFLLINWTNKLSSHNKN